MAAALTARVAALHRFPVKSLLGEPVTHVDVDERGVVGDRRWSVRTSDGKIGSGKTTRRFGAVPGLLDLRAAHVDGAVVVAFPDGTVLPVDDPRTAGRLARHVGRPVTVALETDVSHFDDGPVSLLGRASVDALGDARGQPVDPARFRANVLLDGVTAMGEERWVGGVVRVGTAVLRVALRSQRCVMVNMATADLPAQPGNLHALGGLNGGNLGVVAEVLRPGRIRVGDAVEVVEGAAAGATLRR